MDNDALDTMKTEMPPRFLSGVHWLVILTSLGITCFAYTFSRHQLEEKNLLRFDREAQQVLRLTLERMSKYEDGLWGGVGLFMGSDEVSEPEWMAYAEALDLDRKYPGINGIGVIFHLRGAEALHAFEVARRRNNPDYRVFPERDAEDFYPITYIVPKQGNDQAIGLDVGHETNRRAAAESARDSGEARITGPIVLVQDETRTPGFLLYAPFYHGGPYTTVEARRRNFVGLVYAPFVMRKLMAGTLASENRHVRIRIRDLDGGEIVFDEDDQTAGADPDPLFERSSAMEIYGRRWEFEIHSSLAFRKDADSQQPRTILIAGLSIDALLVFLFVTLSRTSHRALGLATTLRRKTARLERSNRDLEDFAYAASHDLKAPLRRISALGQWLREDCAEAIGETGRDYLEKMNDRIARMDRLLEDLLAYARLGGTPDPPEPCDLRDMVDEVLDWLHPEPRPRIKLSESLPVDVVTSRAGLQLVLRNLIQNAIKHNDKDVIEIEIIAEKRSAEQILLAVRDNGPGIPENAHDEAFRMFRKLGDREAAEGSGIGLAMVKRVVEARGGSVRIAPVQGPGVSIEVLWPLG